MRGLREVAGNVEEAQRETPPTSSEWEHVLKQQVLVASSHACLLSSNLITTVTYVILLAYVF